MYKQIHLYHNNIVINTDTGEWSLAPVFTDGKSGSKELMTVIRLRIPHTEDVLAPIAPGIDTGRVVLSYNFSREKDLTHKQFFNYKCGVKEDDNCDMLRCCWTGYVEVITFDGNIYRFKDRLLHCDFAPAIVIKDSDEELLDYWFDGKYMEKEEWFQKIKGNKYWNQIMAEELGGK